MSMDVKEMRDKLNGPYMLTVTPFKDNFDLDLEAVRKNVRFLLDNGIRGSGEAGLLIPVAGFGEGVYLSPEEHSNVVKAILDEVDGEVPVFPGVHLNGTLEAEKYCKHLQDMGAAGVQLSPPSAYAQPSDDDIVAYYKRVGEAAPNLGIIAYATYWEWGEPPYRDMTPDLVGRLLEIKNFVGVKWGSKTVANWKACLEEHAGKCAFFHNMPIELTIPFYAMGGRGNVCGQFAPWYSLKIKGLLEERKYAEAWDELGRWAIPWGGLLSDMISEGKNWIAITKALIEVSGLRAGPPRPPQKPLERPEYKRIEDLVRETGIMQR